LGELVQIDASIHDWLEGRGQELVLITMIDDATGRLLARFYAHGTVEAHMDLLGRWLRKYGRPVALYSDRHSIFEPQDKGRALPDAVTQFGRALEELQIGLIRAHSPQAKGRVERSFGTAQDRWVKELRLAGATTQEQANAVLARVVPDHNRRFARKARDSRDAHRELGRGYCLEAILSIQEQRVVSNDYVVRFANRFYQVLKPVYPGLRQGKVVVEQRLDGSLALRFGERYLKYREIGPEGPSSAAAGDGAEEPQKQPREKEEGGKPWKPGPGHPWREPYKRQK
jgi:hypothetical protein